MFIPVFVYISYFSLKILIFSFKMRGCCDVSFPCVCFFFFLYAFVSSQIRPRHHFDVHMYQILQNGPVEEIL